MGSPSASNTSGLPSRMMATSLLVVPRSMPRIISDMIIPLMFAVCPQVSPDAEPSRPVFVQRTYQLSLKHVTVYFCLALQRCITHAVLCNAMQRSFGVRGARMFEYHRGRSRHGDATDRK